MSVEIIRQENGFTCQIKTQFWESTIAKVELKKNGLIKRFVISGRKQIYKFLDWIYKDSIFYLERKYNKYKQYKKEDE